MTVHDRDRLSMLFESALSRPAAERDLYLDEACSGDATLRRELASLLAAHTSAAEHFDALAASLHLAPPDDEQLVEALRAALAGTYRIERELGGGGMSRVFLAEEIALGRRVVIKTVPRETSAAVNLERFRREIAVIAQLQHPHIVPLLTANAGGQLLFYTMPYVAGESLRVKLAASGPLAVSEALAIWRDVLDALAHAHASAVVHRDVKPANILISGRNAIVADFGIARAIELSASPTNATITGPIGTPAYMAPEQANPHDPIDHRADIYSAGLVMYEMLAGRTPFRAATAREYITAHATQTPEPLPDRDIPPRVAELVMRCLAKEPEARPASANAILAELDDAPSAHGHRRLRRWMLAAAALTGVSVAMYAFRSNRAVPATSRSTRHVVADSVRQWYQRGKAEQHRRTREGSSVAMRLLERAVAADSEFANAWAAIALTAQFASIRGWHVNGRSPDSLVALAVRASRRAVDLDSTSVEAWTAAGKVAGTIDLEDRASALFALRRAIALDSNFAEAWFEFGLAEEEALDPKEAEHAWLRAAALDPANVQVLAFLAFHCLWYDDFAQGQRWADSAVALSPSYFLARDAAAYIAIARGQAATAARHAEAELRVGGHEPLIPPSILATAAIGQADTARATRFARQAESLVVNTSRPSKHEVSYLAAALAAVGDTSRAIRWLTAYSPRGDLHFQLHLKRDPGLRWIARVQPALLTPEPGTSR